MNPMPSDEASLRQLAEQKEKEWKHLQDLRSQTLESAIQHKETQLTEERAKFIKLKDDFKYNLQLLADRDEELDKYEIKMKDLRHEAADNASECSELRIKIADLEDKVLMERRLTEEAQAHYQRRLRQKHDELEEYRMAKDIDVQKDRDEIEILKRKFERQLTELEGELELQKRELALGSDEAMKKREHEWQLKRDEMSNQLLAGELKIKLLVKEIEVLTKTHDDTEQEFTQVAENHRQLEKDLKEKTWELKDVTAMKDARIRDLERDLEKSQLALGRIREDYERKHENLDKHCREQEQVSDALRQARDDSERHLQNQIHQLEERLNGKEIEMRNLEWTNKDMLEDKDRIIQELHDQLHQTKTEWDRHVTDLSKSTVQRDVQFQNAVSDVDKLKGELEQRKADIERYKRELSLAVQREAQLEKNKAQLNLDWSRRFEDVEREQYNKVEDLVQKLTTSRDEALSDLRQAEADLQHQQKLAQVLMRDRDQALATLKHHGFSVKAIQLESDDMLSAAASRDMDNLRQQNAKLKSVIGLMREEMEKLGNQSARPEPLKEAVAVILDRDSDYVKNLEREVQELRCQSRGSEFQTKVADDVTEAKINKQMGDNSMVRSHVQSLNDQIGSLRREKVEYAAQIKKLQMQIQHSEALNNQLSQQPRQKQVEVDQLQYELGAQSRRNQAEMTSLRHQVSQLELELAQSRQEADEYYKGTLERNLEATSLGNEVSSLKMQLSQKQTDIAFGGQELLIQQLSDQISDLRQRHLPASGDITSESSELKQKLRQAALFIQQLAKEKQQLIEVGNRLRAELVKAGIKLPLGASKQSVRIVLPPPSHSRPQPPAPPGHYHPSAPPSSHQVDCASPPVKQNAMSEVIQNKLGQLEKLQYNLTKQELLFAQRAQQRVDVVGGSSESTADSNPGVYPEMLNTASTVGTQMTSSPSHADPRHSLGISLSSVGGESLQDLWRMVDEGPSELTSRLEASTRIAEPHEPITETVPWVVRGQSALAMKAGNRPVLSARAAGRVNRNKTKQRSTLIRNYNQKD